MCTISHLVLDSSLFLSILTDQHSPTFFARRVVSCSSQQQSTSTRGKNCTCVVAAWAIMEEEAIPILSVVVPAVAGAVVVVVTVVLVFWLGAGRQTSYEDAVKARQGHADRELRRMAEKEKEQKQKREKRRPPRSISKRHEAGKVDGQGEVEATPQQLPQKSILKTTTSKANNVAKDKVRPLWTRCPLVAYQRRC